MAGGFQVSKYPQGPSEFSRTTSPLAAAEENGAQSVALLQAALPVGIKHS